jgi:hypothetical protein
MIGRGKRALCYSNNVGDHAARVASDGMAVEQFGLGEGGFPLLRAPALAVDPMLDFAGFEACLRLLRAQSG